MGVEEHARLEVAHGLGRAAGAVGDHGPAGGLGLDRYHAEVLTPAEKQRPAPTQMVADRRVRLPTQHANGRPRPAPHVSQQRPGADHHERPTQLRARIDGQIVSLVAHVLADHEIVILGR